MRRGPAVSKATHVDSGEILPGFAFENADMVNFLKARLDNLSDWYRRRCYRERMRIVNGLQRGTIPQPVEDDGAEDLRNISGRTHRCGSGQGVNALLPHYGLPVDGIYFTGPHLHGPKKVGGLAQHSLHRLAMIHRIDFDSDTVAAACGGGDLGRGRSGEGIQYRVSHEAEHPDQAICESYRIGSGVIAGRCPGDVGPNLAEMSLEAIFRHQA